MCSAFLKMAVMCLLFVGAVAVRGAESPTPKSGILMSKKLEYSQNLLQALMNDDYEKAAENVRHMQSFTRLEDMFRSERPNYRQQFIAFRDSVADLSQAVRDKNDEHMSAAYLRMIQSCVGCHKELRQK